MDIGSNFAKQLKNEKRYLTKQLKGKENNYQYNNVLTLRHEIETNRQKVEITINSLKNKKFLEPLRITKNLLKYGGESITLEKKNSSKR